jgi:N-formylglutamate amidohydrolase
VTHAIPYRLAAPRRSPAPVVLSSPHSGRLYPPDLLEALGVAPAGLRALEDGPVDRIAEAGCEAGGTLIAATFPRAYVDLNRDADELDPESLGADGQGRAWRASGKARAGLGVVPTRLGAVALYPRPLDLATVERRLGQAWRPYHDQLAALLAERRAGFGAAVLLDCHSMPSPQPGEALRVDVAVGDRFGRSAHPAVAAAVARLLKARGLAVGRNRPYAGGFITEHHGRPWDGVSALQLEFRRALFMDEASHEPRPGLGGLPGLVRELVLLLAEVVAELAARAPRPRLLARA